VIDPSEPGAPSTGRTSTSTVAVHHARRALFSKGLRDGRLQVREIEESLPKGSLTAGERWLLYYSFRAAGIELDGPSPELERPEANLGGSTLPH
jgi:hypothetical protein